MECDLVGERLQKVPWVISRRPPEAEAEHRSPEPDESFADLRLERRELSSVICEVKAGRVNLSQVLQ